MTSPSLTAPLRTEAEARQDMRVTQISALEYRMRECGGLTPSEVAELLALKNEVSAHNANALHNAIVGR